MLVVNANCEGWWLALVIADRLQADSEQAMLKYWAAVQRCEMGFGNEPKTPRDNCLQLEACLKTTLLETRWFRILV